MAEKYAYVDAYNDGVFERYDQAMTERDQLMALGYPDPGMPNCEIPLQVY
jgi:hypothetical protein